MANPNNPVIVITNQIIMCAFPLLWSTKPISSLLPHYLVASSDILFIFLLFCENFIPHESDERNVAIC
jgi:hypothetical protein